MSIAASTPWPRQTTSAPFSLGMFLLHVLLGLALQADSLAVAIKLLLLWPLVLAASASVGFAIARRAQHLGIAPWRKDGS